MTHKVRFTRGAQRELDALFETLATKDERAASQALAAIRRGLQLVQHLPLSCRRASGSSDPRWRELVISFGKAGDVLLFEITDERKVAVLAARHQREDDFFY